MSEPVTAAPAAPALRLPPGPRIPKVLLGLAFFISRRRMFHQLTRRYGNVFTISMPIYGRTVVVADPQLVRQILTSSPEDLGNLDPNSGKLFGPGSLFEQERDDHRQRRRLLAPAFLGQSMRRYETIFEEETLREIAGWPDGQPFATLPSMRRITLNTILRVIFGAQGAEADELRQLIPGVVALGGRVSLLPIPARNYGRYTPWGRLAEERRKYEVVVDKLIEDVRADPNITDRTEVLALLLRSTYEDGSAMPRKDIADELLALLVAGHESAAATLSWAFERLSRHPNVLAALVQEAETDDNQLRQAVIHEVLRARTIIDCFGRHVYAPVFQLGEWVLPRGYTIMVNTAEMHANPGIFPDPDRFDPQRFIGAKPSNFAWTPFGGGTRRCVGAPLALLETDVVLRTVLRHFTIDTTTAPGEKYHIGGIVVSPKGGGRVVVHRRHHRVCGREGIEPSDSSVQSASSTPVTDT